MSGYNKERCSCFIQICSRKGYGNYYEEQEAYYLKEKKWEKAKDTIYNSGIRYYELRSVGGIEKYVEIFNMDTFIIFYFCWFCGVCTNLIKSDIPIISKKVSKEKMVFLDNLLSILYY